MMKIFFLKMQAKKNYKQRKIENMQEMKDRKITNKEK